MLPEDLDDEPLDDLTLPDDLELPEDLTVPDGLELLEDVFDLVRFELEFLTVLLGLVTLAPLLDLTPLLVLTPLLDRLIELLEDRILLVFVTALDNLLVE